MDDLLSSKQFESRKNHLNWLTPDQKRWVNVTFPFVNTTFSFSSQCWQFICGFTHPFTSNFYGVRYRYLVHVACFDGIWKLSFCFLQQDSGSTHGLPNIRNRVVKNKNKGKYRTQKIQENTGQLQKYRNLQDLQDRWEYCTLPWPVKTSRGIIQ